MDRAHLVMRLLPEKLVVAQLPDFGQVADEVGSWLKELPPRPEELSRGN